MHKADRRTIYDEKTTNTSTTGSARRDNSRWSHLAKTTVTWTGDGWKRDVGPVAQTVEHLTCIGRSWFNARLGLTDFFQHSLAKSTIYIYNAQGRQTKPL